MLRKDLLLFCSCLFSFSCKLVLFDSLSWSCLKTSKTCENENKKILQNFRHFLLFVLAETSIFLVLPTFVGLCLYSCLKTTIKNNWLFTDCEHFRHLHFQKHFVYTQNLIHSSRSWWHKGDIENYWLKSKNTNQVPMSFCQSNVSDWFITSSISARFYSDNTEVE